MTDTIQLDEWLSTLYQASLKKQLDEKLTDFKAALNMDDEMKQAATTKMKELDLLIAKRGPRACAFSTRYHNYLHWALD